MRFVLLVAMAACDASSGTFFARSTMTGSGSDHRTWCTTVVLDNPSPVIASEIVVDFDGAERVVVYRARDPQEQSTFACEPLGQGVPLAIARHSGDGMRSEGAGFLLDAHQRLRIEADTEERADAPMRVEVAVTHDGTAAPLDVIDIRRDEVPLDPNRVSTASTFYTLPASVATARFVAFAAQTRHYGIAAQIATAASSTADRILVHYTTAHRWSAPEMTHTQPVRIPDGGGIFVQCEYYNTSTESVGDERCGAWAYFTP